MGPTPVYGARDEKPLQNADFAMKQTNICRLSGDIKDSLLHSADRNIDELVSLICYKKESIAVSGIPSHSYGTSLAIWDHTVLPATRHKRTRLAFTPASRPVLDLPTPGGWKAELI